MNAIDSFLESKMISSNVLMPSQYADERRTVGEFVPERKLMIAVFEMALKDWAFATAGGTSTFQGWDRINKTARRARVRGELTEWFNAEGYYPGSFLWLSDALGLDADAVRVRLLTGDPLAMKRALPVTATPTLTAQEKGRRYREKNRERLRKYNREYGRERRDAEI